MPIDRQTIERVFFLKKTKVMPKDARVKTRRVRCPKTCVSCGREIKAGEFARVRMLHERDWNFPNEYTCTGCYEEVS